MESIALAILAGLFVLNAVTYGPTRLAITVKIATAWLMELLATDKLDSEGVQAATLYCASLSLGC